MRKAIVVAGLTAVFGGVFAAPAFADTGVWVTECDNVFPTCSHYFVATDKLNGSMLATGDFCNGYPAIPMVTEHCIYVEVDVPVAATR
ncbi:MAG: hypothetical protein JO074_08540 [Frankiales bacterium]|nr:hypothetical protein [Frankiales bacterium]